MAKRKQPLELTKVLLVTEDQYLPTLMQLLDHATESIDLLAFSFATGSSSAKANAAFEIAAKLKEIKEANKRLKVRLYIEGKRETSERNRLTAESLKRAGVKVKYGSTHAKGFCIDGRYILFGSTNLTNQSLTKNNETNLLFDEPSVTKEFLEYFEFLWKGGKHGGIHLKPPMLADGAFMENLIEVIDSANSRLDFSIYFFHHTKLQEALIRAHKRKVKITGFIHSHQTFAMSYVRRTLGTVRRLSEGGLKNLYLGPTHLFTHSKYLIRDNEEIMLGTGNWLHEDVEVHPQLYVRFRNKALAKELTQHLADQVSEQGTKFLSRI